MTGFKTRFPWGPLQGFSRSAMDTFSQHWRSCPGNVKSQDPSIVLETEDEWLGACYRLIGVSSAVCTPLLVNHNKPPDRCWEPRVGMHRYKSLPGIVACHEKMFTRWAGVSFWLVAYWANSWWPRNP